jgi:hypothetical protein
MNRTDLIKKARSYIKYWGNPNQFTKWYCKDNKTHAWCGMFVDYVFKKDFKCDWLDKCKNFAYVPTIVQWAKDMKYWTTDYKKAKAGDLVVYNWYPEKKNHYSHVGIVEKQKVGGLQSCEGNTTNSLGKKNCVASKGRGKKYIAGVILLPYNDEEKYNLKRLLKKGCKGADVKELQKTLGGLTCDGVFGDKTYKKVRTFQKSKKISVDGKVGRDTAHALGWLYKGK